MVAKAQRTSGTEAGELGDVMWYVAVLSSVVGVNLETVARVNIDNQGEIPRWLQ